MPSEQGSPSESLGYKKHGQGVYADLFDEDLDSVAANLDAAIRSPRTHRTP
jgi:hypothetical protein